ncbi:hypothetical protein SAMN04515666_101354 [Bosea lupini]|uniref:Uncharacterized protein n=1 Tax=Bosea lupini TaxID=1036779 RepID=A0A1H7GNI8_9HYPH|nr:hypothetical protein [Bosea lupini]SEK37415.1 hypothetical protein SAMN04515666_101354 [Bosea lupini]
MEIVGGLFTAAASAGSAVASGVSSLGGFLAGSGVLTGLQGVTGLLSIAAKNRASQEQKQANFDKAAEAEIDAQAEGVAGQARAVQLRKGLIDAMAERDVAAASGGLDLGFGSPVQAREDASNDAERALSLDALETSGRQQRLRTRSASYIRAGRAARAGGLLESLATGLGTLTDIGARGVVPGARTSVRTT